MVASIVFTAAAVETALVLAHARPVSAIHLSNGRVSIALDCYPSNPRGYFDVDLRDPATQQRYRARRLRRVGQDALEAPFAVELKFNALHYRDAEFGPTRPGRRRVVVLGDSFTEGQGVRAPDVLPRALERRLNADEPGQWEVLNAGRRGADFPALFDSFEEVLSYEPDVLVYALMLNDAEVTDSFRARHAAVYERLARGWESPDENAPFRLARLVQTRLDSRQVERDTTRWYRELYGGANREGWERTQVWIREMDRRMRHRGGRLLVVTWPVLAGLEGDYPFEAAHREIAAFCIKARIAHHDLLPALRGRASSSLWVHPVDRHPNEIAHHLAALSAAPLVRGLATEPRPPARQEPRLRTTRSAAGASRGSADPRPAWGGRPAPRPARAPERPRP